MNLDYLMRRLLQIVPLLIGVSILGFSLMHLAPGGPTAIYATNPSVTAEDIERIKQAWGLNDPMPVQYLRWARKMLVLDFGTSYRGGAEVRTMVADRVPATIQLMGTAYVFAIIVGLGIGTLSALRQYSVFDYLATTGSLIMLSIPTFWFGLMVIFIFAEQLGWIPSGGSIR